MIGWLDEPELETEWFDTLWPDAPADPETLALLLTSAWEACAAFAPALGEDEPIPVRYKEAQVKQARAQHRSAYVNSSDQLDGAGYTVTVYPMDRTVKALLRPRSGRPVIL